MAGTQASATTTTTPKSSTGLVAAGDVVGSALLPARGTIVGAVSAAGRVTFAYKGKSVTHLKPGKYLFVVTDRSSSSGFLVQKASKAATDADRRGVPRQALVLGRPHRRQVARPAEGRQGELLDHGQLRQDFSPGPPQPGPGQRPA